jgi:hypothetical protein
MLRGEMKQPLPSSSLPAGASLLAPQASAGGEPLLTGMGNEQPLCSVSLRRPRPQSVPCVSVEEVISALHVTPSWSLTI